MLVLIWAKTWFTRGITVLFIALIIACYFIPEPAGAWVMRLFVLFLGCARALHVKRTLGLSVQARDCFMVRRGVLAESCAARTRALTYLRTSSCARSTRATPASLLSCGGAPQHMRCTWLTAPAQPHQPRLSSLSEEPVCRCLPPQGWGVVWVLISLLLMAGGVLAGLAFFK